MTGRRFAAAALLVVLAGCSTSVEVQVAEPDAPTSAVGSDTPQPRADEQPGTTDPEVPADAGDPIDSTTLPDGFQEVLVDGRYRLAAPDGWEVFDEPEDVERIITEGADALEGSGIDTAATAAALGSSDAVFVLDLLSGDNVNAAVAPGADALLDDPTVAAQLFERQYEAVGFTNANLDGVEVEIDGRRGLEVTGSYELDGAPVRVAQLIVQGDG